MPAATLNVLPPLDSFAPFPAFGYLQGYLRRERPELTVETRYWNRAIEQAVDPRGRGWSFEQWCAFCGAAFVALALEAEGELSRAQACARALAAQQGLQQVLDEAALGELVGVVDALLAPGWQQVGDSPGQGGGVVACSLEFHQELASLAFLRLAKARCPSALTVLGGRVDVELARRLVEAYPFVDACVYDEGPRALVALCDAGQSGERPREMPGAAWRDGADVRVGEPSPPQADIEEHFADYSGFDFAVADTPEQMLGIWDSRGCWWQRCSFCNRSGLDHAARFRSADSVLREVEAHLAAHPVLAERPVRVFLLGSESIGKDAGRFVALLRGLDALRKQRHAGLSVTAIISPVRLDEEIVALLDRLQGQLIIGFERWDTMLATMHKPHRVEHGIRAVKLLSRHPGVRYNFPLLIGHPGETLGSVDEAARNIWRMRYLLRAGHPRFNVTPVETYRCSALGEALGFDNDAVIAHYERAPITALLALLGTERRAAAELLTYRYPLPNLDETGTLVEAARRLQSTEARIAHGTPTLTVERDGEALRLQMAEGERWRALELPLEAATRVLAETEWITTERTLAATLGDGWDRGQSVVAQLEEHDLLYRDARRGALINTLPAAAQQQVARWAQPA